ncbi:MAG TPA: hypothetical protein VFF69_15305, partial [Phycisphaerales bacterium]|nr:hypothetical protein [Phycisphaerales bacterium]
MPRLPARAFLLAATLVVPIVGGCASTRTAPNRPPPCPKRRARRSPSTTETAPAPIGERCSKPC